MPLFIPRLSLFSLTLFILSLYTIKASDSDSTRPLTFPETISIPQYQNYSIDLSSCYDSGVSRIFIDNEKSSRLFSLIETQSEDIQYIHDIHPDIKPTLASFRPWLVLNTSEIGSFVANIETFTKNTPLCSFKINVNVIDPKGHDCPGIAYRSNLEAVKSGKSSLEILFPESSCRRDLLKSAIKGPKGAFIYKERLGAPIELGREKLLHIQQDLEIPGRFVIYTKGADSQKIFMKTCIINDNHADIQCESQELNAFRLKASVKDFKTVNSFVVFTVEEFPNTLIAYWNRPVEGKNLAVPLHGGLCDSFDTFDSLTEMYLFCISKDSVKVWDAKIHSLDVITIINAESLGLSSFKPMMVQALPGRAGTVVIKTPDEILLVKLSFSKDRKCELLSTIKVPNGDYTFVVNGDHLVILSEDGNIAIQYDIQDSKAPRLINTCTECHGLNLKEGIAKSTGSSLFAISTGDRVNIYNTRVPGFMNTFSSLNLDDQSSKIADIIPLDTASDLMFIHSADENILTLQRIYQTPAFYPAPKSTKPRTGPIRDNLKDNSVLMVPQGYSPIGFALFIIAIVYIVIIFICIGRRIIKTRRMQRIADEQAAIMLPQEEGGEPVPPIAENVDIGVNNQGEGQQGRNNDNRYVAINDDDSTRIDASNS